MSGNNVDPNLQESSESSPLLSSDATTSTAKSASMGAGGMPIAIVIIILLVLAFVYYNKNKECQESLLEGKEASAAAAIYIEAAQYDQAIAALAWINGTD